MKAWRRVAVALIWAMVLGAVVAAPFGGDDGRVPVELWFVLTSVGLAWSIARKTIVTSALADSELRGLIRFRRSPADPGDGFRPLALEGAIIAARDSERAFAHRLRPRLSESVEHFLRFNHGIDSTTDPAAAKEFLGASAWLVDPDVNDRKPTMAELDDLLELLEPRS